LGTAFLSLGLLAAVRLFLPLGVTAVKLLKLLFLASTVFHLTVFVYLFFWISYMVWLERRTR